MIVLGKYLYLEETTQIEQWPDASSLAHSSLKVHCSYRLKFVSTKNHLRRSSLSNCSLLGNCFIQSCSTCPQRSKYTEGVALRMCICIAVQRLIVKSASKKKKKYTLSVVVPRRETKASTISSSANIMGKV